MEVKVHTTKFVFWKKKHDYFLQIFGRKCERANSLCSGEIVIVLKRFLGINETIVWEIFIHPINPFDTRDSYLRFDPRFAVLDPDKKLTTLIHASMQIHNIWVDRTSLGTTKFIIYFWILASRLESRSTLYTSRFHGPSFWNNPFL